MTFAATTFAGSPFAGFGISTTAAPVVPSPIVVMPSSCFGLTTVGDIIRRALRAILVEGSDGGLQPDEYQDGLDALNDYMAAIEAQGIKLGYRRACGLSDAATIPDGAIRGVVANLAIELAPQFSGRVSAALVKQASEGLKAMRLLGVHVGQSTLYPTLPGGSGNYSYNNGCNNVFELSRAPFVTMSMANNRRVTTISVIDGAEKINGFWSLDKFRGLHPDISGRITNTGDVVDVTVQADFILSGESSIATALVAVVQSGYVVLYEEVALTTNPLAVSITGALTIDPGDYLEFYVANRSSTVNINVPDALVRIS